MPPIKVNVKWGKQKFDDVEVNSEEPPEIFKAQLYALSGVPPDRQKLMIKGKTIQDNAWGDVKLSDGVGVMMMGSTDGIPVKPPTKNADDDDDMGEDDKMPLGLVNLGNTCYLNATLQCFRAVPELRQALKGFSGKFVGWESEPARSQSVTAAVKSLYDEMDTFPDRVIPMVVVETMRKVYPRFAEQSEHGGFAQQDANEAWTEVIQHLKKQLPPLALPAGQDSGASSSAVTGKTAANFIEQFLQIELAVTMKCKESETEPVTNSTESALQLSCFINQDVKYLQAGLSSRMKETITKRAESLGRDAEFEKIMKISRLPAYLTVQLVRFFFKERAAVGAKVLKDVKFQLSLDVFDLCSEELQKKLMPNRLKFKERDDDEINRDIEANRLNKITSSKLDGVARDPPFLAAVKPTTGTSIISMPQYDDYEWKDGPSSFPDDIGSSNSGFYELQAVLTHQGRTNNSGHYVAWVRRSEDVWLKFDDDKVSAVTSDEVLKLSGGGDWHCAYLLLYGPKAVPTKVMKPKPTTSHADMPTD